MLRRFEIYSLDPKAPPEKLAVMRDRMKRAQHYIPEVLHSAVGDNQSQIGVQLIWEHAYESVDSYRRYMIHPFHANIYDRYLLNDSPERLVSNNSYDVGLLGYSCPGSDYLLKPGSARRLVLMRIANGQERFVRALIDAAQARNRDMSVSVYAANTFATRWLDGETQILSSTTWSHIWEQGYASLEMAAAAGNDWHKSAGEAIESFIELWYPLDAGYETR